MGLAWERRGMGIGLDRGVITGYLLAEEILYEDEDSEERVEFMKELERRWAEIENGTAKLISAEEALRQAHAHLDSIG